MNYRFIKELEKQLPILKQNDVVDDITAEKIRNFYNNQQSDTSGNTILTIVGSLAAVLIGSGIILLFAYNWNTIPRWMRTCISFIPLIGGQTLVYYSRIKNKSTAWVEFSAIFLSLAIGSVIALISQIYQIPGDLENFLFIWMLLILPLNYLTGSIGSLSVYLTGILFWCGFSQAADGHAVYYWLLLGAMIPKLIKLIREELHSNKTAIMSWLIVINLLIGTGISLEKVVPGLWILIYSLLLIFCFLAGVLFYKESQGGFYDPFKTLGSSGIVILSYLFTFEFFWDEIGLNDLRHDWGKIESLAVFDYLILLILLILVIYLLVKKTTVGEIKKVLPFISIFILALFSFILGSVYESVIPQIVIFNIYTMFLGGWIIYRGITSKLLQRINIGMLTVLLIIVTRFFDMEISFSVKGIIFIVLGIIFLLINKYLSKKFLIQENKL
jgi:uncharacterized membrane protein